MVELAQQDPLLLLGVPSLVRHLIESRREFRELLDPARHLRPHRQVARGDPLHCRAQLHDRTPHRISAEPECGEAGEHECAG